MLPKKYFSIKKLTRKSLFVISIIVLLLDGSFVSLNYYTAKNTLQNTLIDRAQKHQTEFNIALRMTYLSMAQVLELISNDQSLNQIFLQGKKALDISNTDIGKGRADQARQLLLAKIKPAWDKLTAKFDVRQLHYHLGPGSISFLRVHKPAKYGDNMDDIRHIIVDTNTDKKSHYGFETGRIYSGLRSVAPIWTVDPETQSSVYVGALETGTSFAQLLPIFSKFYHTDIAVLLTREHVESNMWPQFINDHFKNNLVSDFYLEAVSSENIRSDVKRILPRVELDKDYSTEKVQLVNFEDRQIAAYHFPLYDYQGSKKSDSLPVGIVLLWEDVSEDLHSFYVDFWINVIYAVFGFIVFETVLFWAINREKRLTKAEQEATFDGLTGVYNRRAFDIKLEHEISVAKRRNSPVALIVCDVDYFKNYNDLYGHRKGDYCLQKLASTLKQGLREHDWLARYGGEEFVAVLPNTNIKSAVLVAERLRKAIEELALPSEESADSPCVTLSFGVSCTETISSEEDLFETADANLYRAKKCGRNRVVST
ncbi:MAG: diguanylate cyclase [Desulfuromusa sp.]|jgi:diguanylate cyclase (GGDEF)-like protein|nr:diguanylate cyclase [Desulfuromusa sp.]